RQQDPRPAGQVIGGERGHEPEYPGNDQLHAEQDREHQERLPRPGQHEHPRDQREYAVGEHPAPVPAELGEHVGGLPRRKGHDSSRDAKKIITPALSSPRPSPKPRRNVTDGYFPQTGLASLASSWSTCQPGLS